MKKRYKLLIGAGVVFAGCVVTYNAVNTAPTDLPTSSERMVAILEDGGCMLCHSHGAELPFYANFPIAKGMIEKDIAYGLNEFDMTETMAQIKAGQKIGKVALNKLQFVFENDLMPPFKYSIMHWGSSITSEKQAMALEYLKEQRALYSNGLAAADFANEPVQPVPVITDLDSAKIALGFKLFHDKRLSIDNTVSCATCHGLHTGGVDNKQFSEGVMAQVGGVNAPTVYNAVFNHVQFWDGRAADLSAQAGGPPMNPIEMGNTSWDQIIEKLQADKDFSTQFLASYPAGYSEATITNAIAEFEKTLTTPDCPFDLYLKGDQTAINDSQKRGYQLFKDNKCATCHAGTNLGGQSFERLGLVADYFGERGTEVTTEDLGRFKETQTEFDKHRFKVPTLRNLTLTAPYYHDGTIATIEDAVDNMMKYQVGKTLTADQRADMVQFLSSLTAPISLTSEGM